MRETSHYIAQHNVMFMKVLEDTSEPEVFICTLVVVKIKRETGIEGCQENL